MLLTGWTDLSGCLTFSRIREKLDSAQYASLFDFYFDMRLFLELRNPQTTSSPTVTLILDDITQRLTRKVMNLPRSKEERDFLGVKKLLERISVILSAMVMHPESAAADGLPESAALGMQPFTSPKAPPQAGHRRIEALQQQIAHLRTPEELQAVLHILQKHIPQFSLAPEVIIEGRYITKACANELRDYVNSVNA
jgi:hypothetical protein